ERAPSCYPQIEVASDNGLIVASPAVQPDLDYSLDRLETAADYLTEVAGWDAETAEAEAVSSHLEIFKEYLKALQAQRATKRRCEAMLAQVEAWEPDSSVSRDLKTYMGERLTAAVLHGTF